MKIEIKEDRAKVWTRPTPRLLAILPQLEGQRRWLKEGALSIASSGHNIDVLREAFPEACVERHGDGRRLATDEFDVGRPPYTQKTSPLPHQVAPAEKCRSQDVFAFVMDPGLGKTKVAIDRAGELYHEGKITGVLVITKRGVHRQWIEAQLPIHCGCDWFGAFWEGNKARAASESTGCGLEFFSIGFDSAKAKKGEAATLEFVERHRGRLLIIVDESHDIKNVQSARHKALERFKRAARSPYRIIMTGTLIGRDLTDAWAQYRWLDEDILGHRYVRSFQNEYCIMGGFEGRAVTGHRNIAKFKEKVEPFTFRQSKKGLRLPKVYERWTFDLTKEQKQAIAELKQDLRMKVASGETIDVKIAASAVIKVQQISNGFITDENQKAHEIVPLKKNPRINALLDYLDAVDGKVALWARFREDINLISKALETAGISFVKYVGASKESERVAAVKSFVDPKGARVFLSNPQAGGTGLNLQGCCNRVAYFSNNRNGIERWQSEDRVDRIGTEGAVIVTDIICKGAYDYQLLAGYKSKKGLNELALGDVLSWVEEAT